MRYHAILLKNSTTYKMEWSAEWALSNVAATCSKSLWNYETWGWRNLVQGSQTTSYMIADVNLKSTEVVREHTTWLGSSVRLEFVDSTAHFLIHFTRVTDQMSMHTVYCDLCSLCHVEIQHQRPYMKVSNVVVATLYIHKLRFQYKSTR